MFETPVAESLSDEASGGDLSGKKSAKKKKIKNQNPPKQNRMQGTKQIMCGKVSPWNRETPRHDTLCRILRSSFLSFSLAADESQKNDWGKLSVHSDLCVLLWCFWGKIIF